MTTPRHDAPDNRPSQRRDSQLDRQPEATPEATLDLRIAAERRLLSALCQNSLEEPARHMIVEHLQNRTFAAPENEIVFLVWTKLRAIQTEPTREAITASVTRLGFPDLDFDSLFRVIPPTADEVPPLLRQV